MGDAARAEFIPLGPMVCGMSALVRPSRFAATAKPAALIQAPPEHPNQYSNPIGLPCNDWHNKNYRQGAALSLVFIAPVRLAASYNC